MVLPECDWLCPCAESCSVQTAAFCWHLRRHWNLSRCRCDINITTVMYSVQSSQYITSTQVSCVTHFTVLRRLHWLPVFKLALLIHKSLLGQLPPYLADRLIADSSRHSLRSSVTSTFVVPRTNSTFCNRSTAVAGSRIWNGLPTSLRSVDRSTERFKRTLKTFLFVWHRGTSATLFKARWI